MQRAENSNGKMSAVDIDEPDLKQSIAWGLACKAVRHKELQEADTLLLKDSGADTTRNIQVCIFYKTTYGILQRWTGIC